MITEKCFEVLIIIYRWHNNFEIDTIIQFVVGLEGYQQNALESTFRIDFVLVIYTGRAWTNDQPGLTYKSL